MERVADVAHTAETLGFTARVGLDEGLSATVDWIRDSIGHSPIGLRSTEG